MAEVKETKTSDKKSLKLNPSQIYFALLKRIQQLHGDFGVAATKIGLRVKYCNEDTNLVLIRAQHGSHKLVASALPLVTDIDKKDVVVNSLYVGATISHCFKFIMKRQREKYDEFVRYLKSEKERQLLYKMLFYNEDDGDGEMNM